MEEREEVERVERKERRSALLEWLQQYEPFDIAVAIAIVMLGVGYVIGQIRG